MRLFWKIYLSVLISFLVIIVFFSYSVIVKEVSEVKRQIIEENQTLGSLIAKEVEVNYLNPQWSFESLKKVSGYKGVLFWWVADDNGAIRMLNDKAHMETNILSYFTVMPVIREGESVFIDEGGKRAIYFKPFNAGQNKWLLCIGFSMKGVAEKRNEIIVAITLLSMSALLILGIILYFSIRYFTKPIRGLIEGSDKIGKGDLSHRITINSEDEIGRIARSFNTMAERLQQRTVPKDVLDEEKQRFMKLAEQAPFGMALIDKNGSCKYINPKFQHIFGYNLNDIPTGREWFRKAFPDPEYRSHVIKTWLDDFRISTYGEKIPRVFDITCKDGTVKTIHILSVILDSGQYLITYEDITEQKKTEAALKHAEEKYRKIFEGALEGIFQATLDGRLISANPAFARILGYDSPEELADSIADIWEQLCPDPLIRQEFTKHLFEKGEVRNHEIQSLRRDRESVWLSINVRMVRDKRGKPLYCEATLEDMGTRKKLEAEQRQAHKMDAIGTLAGGIAHDFNNLLTGIQGYASLMLLNKSPAHPDYERLKKIEEQVESAANLTKQLLGFARKGRQEIKRVELSKILDRTSVMFEKTRNDINIEKHFQEGLWFVNADERQIEQMLLNLYMNASDAMPGGGTLYLETANTILEANDVSPFSIEPGSFAKITVTDTGIGMDEKTRQRIFEPFFTTKEMARGTGLGLASVYGIVKGHGGIINVFSEKGHGTTFHIYFPATAEETAREMAEGAGTPRGGETILLVNNEEIIIEVSKQIIETLGYNVLVARSGEEAVNLYRLQLNHIKVVILDMVMPDSMSDKEIFDALWAINPDAKLILSGSHNMSDLPKKIAEQGRYAFIRKPFGIDQLSQKLGEVLES